MTARTIRFECFWFHQKIFIFREDTDEKLPIAGKVCTFFKNVFFATCLIVCCENSWSPLLTFDSGVAVSLESPAWTPLWSLLLRALPLLAASFLFLDGRPPSGRENFRCPILTMGEMDTVEGGVRNTTPEFSKLFSDAFKLESIMFTALLKNVQTFSVMGSKSTVTFRKIHIFWCN